MRRSIITAALASAAILVAGPALAKGRGNGHGGHGGHVGVGVGHDGHGSPKASARARVRANANSAVARGATIGALADLRAGMVVRDVNGVRLGTVRKVLRSGDGTVRNVLVASADGRRTIPLAPDSLTLSGDAVTTTRLATSKRRR